MDEQQKPELNCCHHWIIQPAVGPVSEGACRKCGEVKEFKNSIDYETEWSGRRNLARSDIQPTVVVVDPNEFFLN